MLRKSPSEHSPATPLDAAAPIAEPKAYRPSKTVVVLGIILVALNLRGAITGIGPLLPQIGVETGLTSGVAGLLATLPLLAFAVVSPIAPRLAAWRGIERALFLSLGILVIGLALRIIPSREALFAGTALAGAGIAIGNVLVPGLIRRDYPQSIALLMGLFTTTMVLSGGLASGLAEPLARWGGWRFSLAVWALPALVALFYWLPLNGARPSAPIQPDHGGSSRPIWNIPLAWQVTLFMGFQSCAFYTLIAWLPAILLEQGIAPGTAGWLLSGMQFMVLATSLTLPLLMRRLPDQVGLNIAGAAFCGIGFAGLLLMPQLIYLWIVIFGLGCGSSLVLSLSMFALRTANAEDTTKLSGMAQSIGYLMAMVVPVVLGVLFDLTGSWTVPLAIMIGLAGLQAIAGGLAGRARLLRDQGNVVT